MLFGYPFHSAYMLGSAKEKRFLGKGFSSPAGRAKAAVQHTIPPQHTLLSFPILYKCKVKHDLTLPSGGTELAWRRETHSPRGD